MKKMIAISLAILFLLVGCQTTNKNITFQAKITERSVNNINVETINFQDFDKAIVGFSKAIQIVDENGNPIEIDQIKPNDIVEITIQPEIRESYPVQVTATKIKRLKSEDNSVKTKYQTITPKQAKEMMENEDVIIVDVRNQDEYDIEHIPNSLLIPVDNITKKAPEMLKDKEKTILVYCRSGRRSAIASEQLANMGYTNVFDFGGIIDWTYKIAK